MKGGNSRSRYTKVYTEKVNQSGGLGAGSDSCKLLAFTIILQKVTDAATGLRLGDELEIKRSGAQLRAIDVSGVLCGNIIAAKNLSVIECMEKGYEYKAIVSSIKGSSIYVDVQIA